MSKMCELEEFRNIKIVTDPLDITANARKELVNNLRGRMTWSPRMAICHSILVLMGL